VVGDALGRQITAGADDFAIHSHCLALLNG
jgi:hypothetical protein